MKAIVAGAGIAGPVAAAALNDIGIEAEVFEAREADDGNSGLFLGLAKNGHRVLAELGFDDCVRAQPHIQTPRIAFFGSRGNRLGEVSNGRTTSGEPITLMRHSLNTALSEEVARRGISIHRGKAITGYHQDEAGVTVLLADGQELRADLLVGADGIGSKVRAAMPASNVRPSFTGLLNLGGIVQRSGLAPTEGEMRMIWGRRAFFGYAVRPDGEAWWFANVGETGEPSRADMALAREAWLNRLLTHFASDQPLVNDLIRRTSEIFAYPIHDLPHVPRWQDGRVVLIGDAAHATSPSSGQGASLALEDAAFLAICLRDIPNPAEALARFEAVRRPRAERIVAEGRRRGTYKAPRTRLQMQLRDALMPFVLRFFATERALAWIHDYRVPQLAN